MQDRPTMDELLEAVAGFLHDDVMPNTSGRLSFHARVAGNVIQMLRRELDEREDQIAREWQGLDGIIGKAEFPETVRERLAALTRRNEELSELIRSGGADQDPVRGRVLAHLRAVTIDKITITDPRLAAEAAEATESS